MTKISEYDACAIDATGRSKVIDVIAWQSEDWQRGPPSFVRLQRCVVRHFIRLPFDELLRSTERAFESYSHQLAARLHTSLAEQPLHYVLNATFREAHVVTNLPVGEASQDAQKDIPLAVFQRSRWTFDPQVEGTD